MEKQGQINEKVAERKEKQKPINPNGRPPNKLDEGPRKKRVETPKSTPGVAELVVWATSAFESVEFLNKGYLEVKSKANLRQLTKEEANELDTIKLSAFLALEPMSELSNENLFKAVSSNINIPNKYKDLKNNNLTSEVYKKAVVGTYIESIIGQK
jgi:hypothetical protein